MTDTDDSRKRWDTDDRFVGVADAGVFAASVEELAALAHRPGWVAEEPEVHLEPHLRGAAVAGVRMADHGGGTRLAVGQAQLTLQVDAVLGRERHVLHRSGTIGA